MRRIDLMAFLLSYKTWLDEGAPEEAPYTRNAGLCCNVWRYAAHDQAKGLRKLLAMEFFGDDICTYYPFDTIEGYEKRALMGTHHLNPCRIAWVTKKLEELREA